MALTSSRQALALLAAVGVTAPVVWWALDSSRHEVDAAVRLSSTERAAVVDGETRNGHSGETSLRLESGDRAASNLVAAPRGRSGPGEGRVPMSTRVDPSGMDSLDLGVLLRGEVHTDVPGLSGAVFIRAEGPDGRAVDASGTIGEPYSLLGLSPGHWELILRGSAILEQSVSLEISVDRGAVERDLLVRPAPVIDVVYYTTWGERLEAVLAEPGRDPAGFPRLELVPTPGVEPAWPGEKGGFRRAIVPDDPSDPLPLVSGWLDLRTAPPVEVRLLQAGRELDRREIDEQTRVLEFQVNPLEESGRPALTATFVDAVTGIAIEQAVVELYRVGEPAPVRTRSLAGGGVLRLAGIATGDWILSVLSSGRAHLLRPFTIEAEGDYALGTIELEPAVAFSGRLVGPDGRPLGNRAVRWSRAGGTSWLAATYGHALARTDAGGYFALPAVPPGEIVLQAGGDEFAAELFKVRAGTSDLPVELRLSGGMQVEFVLLGSDDVDRFELEVRDDLGRLVASRLSAVGRVTRAVLAPGSYTVHALSSGAQLTLQRFVVADGPTDVELHLSD
ncbi:carboxypeptidase-like regulatory domain-containing protein [Engelhardtia mirabilis]|uniref:Carboxypeptidase regulatory-like domain-containing protein n=1 Tax=Engelhardtia mirabilis TaxID=2528011 RepID=A0A518BFC9_9BACT|nr:hypothetical protein Pla133_06780 [Planctomycetes bacterium Pla133]QDU99938.1 hypothetical protein Pla86_06770 [Planctomycetes bacterium Pla86]